MDWTLILVSYKVSILAILNNLEYDLTHPLLSWDYCLLLLFGLNRTKIGLALLFPSIQLRSFGPLYPPTAADTCGQFVEGKTIGCQLLNKFIRSSPRPWTSRLGGRFGLEKSFVTDQIQYIWNPLGWVSSCTNNIGRCTW